MNHVPTPVRYSSGLTLREARQVYFTRSGFSERNYGDRWGRLKAGPIILRFPNTAARVKAVRLHDLHHVLTEYETTWAGEAEIGAWEIASGCGRHYPAWVLNVSAFAIGLVIAPRRTSQAFTRGRRSRNLYHTDVRDTLLDRRVGELRHELGLAAAGTPATCRDTAAFLLCVGVAVILSLVPAVVAVSAAGVIVRYLRAHV